MKTENEEIRFEAPVSHLILPKVFVDTFRSGITTPSVKNCTVFRSPASGSTTVTNFLNGSDQQTIRILGNGTLTIANNTSIKTNTGADKLLAANKVYTFTLISDYSSPSKKVWYENG